MSTDPVEKAITLFHQSIEARASLGEHLAPALVAASELLVNTFVNDGRAFVCGHGLSTVIAQHFTTTLLSQGDRERPALPAVFLDGSPGTQNAIAHSYGAGEVFARQIRALGQPDDLLIIFTTTGNPQSLVNAVQAAHDREMTVLLFNGSERGHSAQLLDGDDLEIAVPIESELFMHEMHLLLAGIMCELVDDRLFGGND